MANLLVFFFRDGQHKKESSYQTSGSKNKEADVDPMGTGSSKPSTKRRSPSKGDCAPKKPKVSLEPVVGLMVEGAKTVTPAKHGAGKGLMIPPPGSQKKSPVLLREDPKYALEKLSLIISFEDYEDLGTIRRRPWGRRAFLVLPR